MPTALLSVYDKADIVDLAGGLRDLGWTLYASGGTREEIKRAGEPVTDTAVITGSSAQFGHRVVTLSSQIALGLLAPDTPTARAALDAFHAPFIDAVVVDPYPTHKAIVEGKSRDEVNEQTDVGGPTMIAEGLRGGRIVVCDRRDYPALLETAARQSPTQAYAVLTLFQHKARIVLAGYYALLAWYGAGSLRPDDTYIGRMLDHYKERPDRWPTTASFFAAIGARLTLLEARNETVAV